MFYLNTNKQVTYSSSHPLIASVDNDGLVTGVLVGNVTMTVTTIDGDKTDTCQITVVASQVVKNVSADLGGIGIN
ncbi:Ig-like domain-containing protein [Bacillus sp. JJ722]